MSDFIFMSKTNMSVVDLCVKPRLNAARCGYQGAGNSAVDMLIRPILSCTSLIYIVLYSLGEIHLNEKYEL